MIEKRTDHTSCLYKSARVHRQEPGRSAARCDPNEFGIGQLIDIREFSRLERLDGNRNHFRDFRSAGVICPEATAVRTSDITSAASLAVLIGGNAKATGLSFRAGQILSMQILSATESPSKAIWMAFLVKACTSPSSRASVARVALFLAPLGRPAGLPTRRLDAAISQRLCNPAIGPVPHRFQDRPQIGVTGRRSGLVRISLRAVRKTP